MRRLLPPVLLVALVGLVAGCGGHSPVERPAVQRFVTRPGLQPPVVSVRSRDAPAGGYFFLAPKQRLPRNGAMIVDARGRLVWWHPMPPRVGATDFRVQRFHGRPVLTWWQGTSVHGHGFGVYEIADGSYHRVAVVDAGHGFDADEHEFTITRRNTALIAVYDVVPHRDLSSVGGPKDAPLLDSGFQEIDIATGRVLFQWRAIDHVGIGEAEVRPPKPGAPPWDYFHINSVSLDRNGDYLISARNTSAVYEISPRDGRILWRLGGRRSDFALGPGTRFAWQHDAHQQADGTITLFDDGADPAVEKFSRGLVLRLDTRAMRATLVRAFVHPRRLLAAHEGNMQVLPSGDVVVGWGEQPYFTQFAPDGHVLLDARFGPGDDSYRVYRFPWVGSPTTDPAVAVRLRGDRVVVYASWNGATEVARWQLRAGPNRLHLRAVATVRRTGFETAIRLRRKAEAVTVWALDRSGRVLGTSRVVRLPDDE